MFIQLLFYILGVISGLALNAIFDWYHKFLLRQEKALETIEDLATYAKALELNKEIDKK